MRRLLRTPLAWAVAALVVVVVVVVLLATRGGASRVDVPTGTYQHLLSSG